MARIENAFEWCLKKGEEGEKHTGLKKTSPDKDESEKQIKKAVSDLDTMQYLYIRLETLRLSSRRWV